MKVFKDLKQWQEFREQLSHQQSVGFVPTMGALHDGHASLIKKSVTENDVTILSIFVNPTQFDESSDFENYPSTLNEDLRLAEQNQVDYVLLPTFEDIYPDNYRYQIHENELSQILCGKSRKGHFNGVLTVVLKLLNLAQATRAYFGEKDYQQYLLIKDMCRSFFIKTEIVAAPIIRESSGLALSSRNKRLTEPEKLNASEFFATLKKKNCDDSSVQQQLEQLGFEIDYIETHNNRRFGAIRIGEVRLIDNVQL